MPEPSRHLIAAAVTASLILPGCGHGFHVRETRTGEWYALSTPHVRLESDAGSREARETAWALEDLHRALAHVFSSCPAGALEPPEDVTLLAHEEDYAAVAPPNSAGFFRPAESGLVAFEPRVILPARSGASRDAVLQTYTHELTHRFVERCLPDAPTWLAEGLAKYFETIRVSEVDVLVGAPPYRFDVAGSTTVRGDGLRFERIDPEGLPSASGVVGLSREDFYAARLDARVAIAHHAAAWALVHMGLAGPDDDLRARFERYLAALRDGTSDPAAALEAAFDGVDLDAALAAYVRTEPIRTRVPYARTALGEPVARRLEALEVDLRWGELFARLGQRRDARAHLALAEQSPALEARAVLVLASMSSGIERHDLVARAAAIAPESRDVLLARAWISIEEDLGAEERAAILLELSSLESPSASELARWADLLRLNGDAQPALALSQQAVELEPWSWEARASLALSYASVHRFPESHANLERALHLTSDHLPRIAAQLERLLARVEQLAPRPAGELPPTGEAEPPEAILDMGRQPIVEVRGSTGATLDARRFGGTCVGFVGTTPAAVLDVPVDTPAIALFAQANGARDLARDTVLVVETSTGAVRCDDDSGGWPDPAIFAQLPPGRTRVWVGTYERERAGTAFTLTIARTRALGREPLPSVCGLPDEAGPTHGPVVVGARVVLGRHTPVSGRSSDVFHPIERSTNWMPEMEAFVGREATVTELEGRDGAGCPIVRVDADAGTWLWRVRDMSRP